MSEDARVKTVKTLLAQYGVRLGLGPGEDLYLEGDVGNLPPDVAQLVEKRRAAIVSFLSRCREWRWAGTLHYVEPEPSSDPHPSNAVLWRYLGEAEWREVPGAKAKRLEKLVIGGSGGGGDADDDLNWGSEE